MLTKERIIEINDTLQEVLSFIKLEISKILDKKAKDIGPRHTVISHEIDFYEEHIEIDAEYSCACYAEQEWYNPDKYLKKSKGCGDSCGRESDWFTLKYDQFFSADKHINSIFADFSDYIIHIRSTIKEFYKLHGWNIRPKNNAYIRSIDFKQDYLLIETEVGCGCCGGETEFHKLPYDCFADPRSYFCFMKLRGDFEREPVVTTSPIALKPKKIFRNVKVVKVPRGKV